MNYQPDTQYRNKPGTAYLTSNFRMDTDVREYTQIIPETPVPTIQRAVRFHIPQIVEPLLVLNPEVLRIGRDIGKNRLDLSRQHASLLGVSRTHAELIYRNGRYYIKDLGSTNGTFLNNVRLEPDVEHQINQNDQLRFGHFVAIVNYT